EEYELYIKKKGKSNIQEFEEKFKNQIKEYLTEEHPYKTHIELEVIVSVSMQENRLNIVDIDNLVKSVLYCFNGLVYEDDSQIIKLQGINDGNVFTPINRLIVCIVKVSEQ